MKKILFLIMIFGFFGSNKSGAAVSTYQDSALTQSADVFADGGKVYVTVSGFSVNGGTKTLYHYQVTSLDTYGKTRVSEDCTFTTISAESLADKIKLSRKLKDLPKTYYVKIGGKDTDSGLSSEQAWEHPSYAAQKAEAGDTIYLLEGRWNDEHLILANSGIDVAPITLTTYDNKISILDGVDKTGFGIRANGKTSWNISGLHLKNYSNGIYFQDKTTDIQVSNFTIENTQNAAITFNSQGPFSRLLFSNFEVYAAGLGAGDTALSYGGGSNFSDIEIFNFNIHDTNGSGIYWRYVDRLHINDGKVYKAAGTDGVGFSLSVCNSIMENLVVDNTQWHGVAVHDWTVGNNPCFNNTIRSCEISNASHNHVDLHSGAYNTLVEKNVLHDQLSFCTGIYFHNRGAGLIARDNNIYRVSRGVSGGGRKRSNCAFLAGAGQRWRFTSYRL